LLPSVRRRSLRALQVRLIKIGARVVRRADRSCFPIAEVPVSGRLFLVILARIRRLLEPVPL